jgi:hypothetical protein
MQYAGKQQQGGIEMIEIKLCNMQGNNNREGMK